MLCVSSASVRFASRSKSSSFRLNERFSLSRSRSSLWRSSSFNTEAFFSYSSFLRWSSSCWRLSCACEPSSFARICSFAFLPASHSLRTRCMSTTATFVSARAATARTRTPVTTPTAVHVALRLCICRITSSPASSILEGPAEREAEQLFLVAGLLVERLPELDPQRPHRREPSDTRAGRVARVAQRDPLVAPVGVAGVEEHDALQPEALHEGEDDLVVH